MTRLPNIEFDIINVSDFNEKVNESRRLKFAQDITKSSDPKKLKFVMDRMPEFIPDNIDINSILREARHMSTYQAYLSFRNKGKWDYKQKYKEVQLYEAYGNTNYGVLTQVMYHGFGFPNELALLLAGVASAVAGTSPLGKNPKIIDILTDPNFADAPTDNRGIRNGFEIIEGLRLFREHSTKNSKSVATGSDGDALDPKPDPQPDPEPQTPEPSGDTIDNGPIQLP